MKKHRKEEQQDLIQLRLWTYDEAKKAIPYLRSLVNSLRDCWLEARHAHTQVERVASRHGHPDRAALIQLAERNRDVDMAGVKLEEVAAEMLALSAYCVDPTAGLAVIPFIRGESLAWFVFDMFDEAGLVAWRLSSDPLETRRPLAELDQPEAAAEGSSEVHPIA